MKKSRNASLPFKACPELCSLSVVKKQETVEVLSIDEREVRVTHPDRLYFSKLARVSKLDLVRYYLSVAPGALDGIEDRPIVLKRFVNGAEGEAFYQKRAPADRPEWATNTCRSGPAPPRFRLAWWHLMILNGTETSPPPGSLPLRWIC